ncbi:hypothetical protein EAI30_06260 [Romboutsia ilealis]|uniref:Uncharacterized protein n=1 Tax=Romboutsia faecis TaxID=2764597 RepID=A0ABR7JP66_9FIRM|nr:hypothetical protein [Romboutsia faecis]MBC5996690.1 hypothetical protein [Romboutsia faecis]MRN24216.1 hypothetical protein [Romboutsia ilealis]
MESRFLDWYSQALGSVLGVLACLFAYVNGYMFVFGNIGNNFDALSIGGVISSYLLFPLCLITLFFSIAKSFILEKHINNLAIDNLNKIILLATSIIGIIGIGVYFIIPALLILFDIYRDFIKERRNTQKLNLDNENEETEYTYSTKEFPVDSLIECTDSINFIDLEGDYELEKEIKTLETKKLMAIELLEKKSDLQFIKELTGFTDKEIQELKNSIQK